MVEEPPHRREVERAFAREQEHRGGDRGLRDAVDRVARVRIAGRPDAAGHATSADPGGPAAISSSRASTARDDTFACGAVAARPLRRPDRVRRARTSSRGRSSRSRRCRRRSRSCTGSRGAPTRRGARYVDVAYFDPHVKRIRDELAAEETLDWVPPWLGRRLLDLGELDAARIVLVPLVPPGLMEGVDPARAGRDRLPSLQEVFQVIDERSRRLDALALPDRVVGADRLPDRDAGGGARGALGRHRARLPARRARPGGGVDAADRRDLAGREPASTRSTSTRCASRGPAPISPSASSPARASRRRAAPRRRAPASATSRTCRRRSCTRRRTRSGPRAWSARRSRSTSRGVARHRAAHPLRGRPRRRDRRRRERRRAPAALLGRRRARRVSARSRSSTARAGSAGSAASSTRRSSTRTRPATWRSATRTPRRSAGPADVAADQRERRAHRLHGRLGRGRGHRA